MASLDCHDTRYYRVLASCAHLSFMFAASPFAVATCGQLKAMDDAIAVVV